VALFTFRENTTKTAHGTIAENKKWLILNHRQVIISHNLIKNLSNFLFQT